MLFSRVMADGRGGGAGLRARPVTPAAHLIPLNPVAAIARTKGVSPRRPGREGLSAGKSAVNQIDQLTRQNAGRLISMSRCCRSVPQGWEAIYKEGAGGDL